MAGFVVLRSLFIICALSWFLVPVPARACKCVMSFSACNEVVASDLVFIGTVESIEPKFLNRWNLISDSSLRSLNEAYVNAEQGPSEVALAHLKDVYLKTFPDLAVDDTNQLNAAKKPTDVASLFDHFLDRGLQVRFSVKTIFKHGDEDDDDADSDDDDDESSFDVWTPFGDCGYDFQAGETYLVYANNEESSDYLFTGSCTRTRRLSDAGDDLAYLFFYKNDREKSARLEGFTTADRASQSNFGGMHEPLGIESAVPGVVVELRSDSLKRYTQSGKDGRFVFDGLAEGDYEASVFASDYPANTQLPGSPRQIHVKEKSCSSQVLVLPKSH
jgi:hypothetical protein